MSPTKDVKRQRRWQFWIDRGGTFTDCLGRDPDTGEIREVKVLSSDRAPLIGIRRLLGVDGNTPIPPCEVRTGTTLREFSIRRGSGGGGRYPGGDGVSREFEALAPMRVSILSER